MVSWYSSRSSDMGSIRGLDGAKGVAGVLVWCGPVTPLTPVTPRTPFCSSEYLYHPPQAGGEFVQLFPGVVKCQRCAGGCGYSIAMHYRFGAVLPRADRNSSLIEELPNVVRMDSIHQE